METGKKIKKVLELIHTNKVYLIEDKGEIVVLTLVNGCKWVVNKKNYEIDVYARDEETQKFINLYVTMKINQFKQWDLF
jgi:hypothetical protein